MKRTALGLLALSFAITAPGLSAASELGATEAMAIKVKFGDLNPNHPIDARHLLRRIRAAALEACGASSFSASGYKEAVMNSECYTASVSRAVEAVNAPAVSQLYRDQLAAHDPDFEGYGPLVQRAAR